MAVILAFQLTQILWDTGDFLEGLLEKGEVQVCSGQCPHLPEPWLCMPSLSPNTDTWLGTSLEVPTGAILEKDLVRGIGLVWTFPP